jgi:hypothetical protein
MPGAETKITFRILPPLYELNRAVVSIPTRGGDVRLSFLITESGQSLASQVTGSVSVPGDDLGSIHNTIVTAEIPELVPVWPTGAHRPGGLPEGQRIVVNLLNRVLGYYRLRVAPQIRPVPPIHARGFKFTQTDEQGNVREGIFAGGNAIRPTGDDAGLAAGLPDVVSAIQEGVRHGPIPLYLSLYLDALADIEAEQFRSGLAHLYMSFEMLASLTFRRLLTPSLGPAAVDSFLDASGDKPGPTVYRILSECWSVARKPAVSKRSFDREVRGLWKHRNDILHGRPLNVNKDMTEQALLAYRSLAGWLETTTLIKVPAS